VFKQDSDFKERMFARQIAVMKGQAWNVVETLKTKDHGPLELTRRARVCVWDDLVDIPIAIPLRTPSSEMRRRADAQYRSVEDEEMDISAANGSLHKNQQDLLNFSPPNSDLPNPNRFDLSRNSITSDLGHQNDGLESPKLVRSSISFPDRNGGASRPSHNRSNTRASDEGVRRQGSSGAHRRTYSSASRFATSPFQYDGDDIEGDLGYAAAEGMEMHQRKVIVERLETVKSKNPVFTWC
jgi:phosphatidylinositol 4-kinase type 2